MKTIFQVTQYISKYEFSEEDWPLVLALCHKYFTAGNFHKARWPKRNSTFNQFTDWIEHGFAPGDIVGYGKTMGILGGSCPDDICFVAYLDFDQKIIVQEMKIQDKTRLKHLDEYDCLEFNKRMYEAGITYIAKENKIAELYTPEKNSVVVVGSNYDCNPPVGRFLESNGCEYHFSMLLKDGELQADVRIDFQYAPLNAANEKNSLRFQKAVTKEGYTFNARHNQYIRQPQRGEENVYWYLNDRFEIVRDKDNGTDKHEQRFLAKNYFLDYGYALEFMRAVKRLQEDN